jgi:putative tryptophan/tyrosine transport system substrate-binding protein
MQLDQLTRREFIAAVGGAAAWPFAARARAHEHMPRVGVLMNATTEEPEAQSYVAAFQQGMQEFGWTWPCPSRGG